VLMTEGHAAGALEKYDEAVKYAPKWKQLQLARELAAKSKK